MLIEAYWLVPVAGISSFIGAAAMWRWCADDVRIARASKTNAWKAYAELKGVARADHDRVADASNAKTARIDRAVEFIHAIPRRHGKEKAILDILVGDV